MIPGAVVGDEKTVLDLANQRKYGAGFVVQIAVADPSFAMIKYLFATQLDGPYAGARRMSIYLLRLVYLLMFFVLGKNTWTHIFTHRGAWEPDDAMSWCVWTAFATLAGLGILRPLKMLPILLLEIFYKVLWLLVVAYPLWMAGELTGSPVENETSAFLWVLLPIVAVPWGYVFANYIYQPKPRAVLLSTAVA